MTKVIVKRPIQDSQKKVHWANSHQREPCSQCVHRGILRGILCWTIKRFGISNLQSLNYSSACEISQGLTCDNIRVLWLGFLWLSCEIMVGIQSMKGLRASMRFLIFFSECLECVFSCVRNKIGIKLTYPVTTNVPHFNGHFCMWAHIYGLVCMWTHVKWPFL